MTDDLTPTDEVEEAPAIEQEATSNESEDPGDDLGALKRALEREREERRTAKEELRRIREDEDARSELLAQWGYEVAEGEPDVDDDEDFDEEPGEDPRLEKLLAWQQEQQAKEEKARFETDFTKFVGDRELSARAEKAIRLEAATGTLGPKELQAAIDDWCAYEDDVKASGRSDYKASKKAPHVSQVGKSATKSLDLDDDEQRVAHMTQRLADMEQ